MKSTTMIITALAICLSAAPAFAVDTTKVYTSGILVILFLGVCALIVVAQLMPAMVMLARTIKGLVRNALRGNPARVEVKK
jgi:hypothetical protein